MVVVNIRHVIVINLPIKENDKILDHVGIEVFIFNIHILGIIPKQN